MTPLTPEKWHIVEEVFAAVSALPVEERERTLERLCGSDGELLREVRSLLKAAERADAWEPGPESSEQTEFNLEAGSKPRRFGSYQLERLIGAGGMGAVYLAHRVDGSVEHKVAVKIIALPFGIRPLEEKFRQERQILASLNHPHITHFIDGGVSSDGELYLIMEYVAGLPIDEYARAKNLTEAERLGLFRPVAGAVAYAHQNLVIHRDLKPGNVLVSEEGVPKLLDFGTAALLTGTPFESANATGPVTVAYASPEQLRGGVITTLSDVYSLGVMLYELLSGEKAFAAGLPARLDAERETKGLAKLGGELDLILRKAMAPEAVQRYSSVEQFAEDVRRYQAGEPVLAHPKSAVYRARKFVHRYRLPVAASAFAVGAIVVGALATSWQAQRANGAQRIAEQRFQEVRQLGDYLVFDIHGGLQNLPGSTGLQKQVVERAMQFLDALSRDASADSELRLEAAGGYLRLGDVLGNPNRASLGERKRAVETYDKALMALGPVLKAEPKSLPARRLAAQIRVRQAVTRDFGGKPQEGFAELTSAVGDLRALAAEAPGDLSTLLALGEGLELVGKRASSGGGVTENSGAEASEKAYSEAEVVLRRALVKRASDAAVLEQLARIEYGRAILWGSTDPNRAIEHHQATAQWLERLPRDAAQGLEVRRLRANNLLNLGWAQGQTQQYPPAIANISDAGVILAEWAKMDPENTTAHYQLSTVYRSRGIVHGYNHDAAAAIQDFLQAAAIHQQLSAKDPTNKVYRYLRGELLARVGNLQQETGNKEEARRNAAEGLTTLSELAAARDASLSHVFGACRWLTETEVVALRDPARAARFCQEAIDRTKGEDPDGWEGLAAARSLLGDKAGAIDAAKRALALVPATQPGMPESAQRKLMEATLERLERPQPAR